MSEWIQASEEPLDVFSRWYEQALEVGTFEPTKMTLATVDEGGMPSARVVLLKGHDEKGLRFYTNYESVKSDEMGANPKAALVFHWEKPLHRQVRVRGFIEKLSYEESDAYFQTRGRGSQIGAWASPQSQEISSRSELEKRVQEIKDKFGENPIPCPENWGGFVLKPISFEFWESGFDRLHDRMKFSRESLDTTWVAKRLAP